MYEIANDGNILKIITNVAALSNEMHRHGKVVFYENEFAHRDLLGIDFERSGFIVCSNTEMFGRIYQFKHLVLMEFFTAIHIFLHQDSYTPDEIEHRYPACMPIISGLHGILKAAIQGKQTDAADVFVLNVLNGPSEGCNLSLISHLCKSLSSKDICYSDNSYEQWIWFLTCLFESGVNINDVSKEHFNVSFIDVRLFHHELIYLLNFLDQLEYKLFDRFEVQMKDKLFSTEEIDRLSIHLLRSEIVDLSTNLLLNRALSYLSSKIVTFKSRKINYLKLRSCSLADNDVIQLSPCIIYLSALSLSANYFIGAAGMNAISTVINNAKATSQEVRLDKLYISYCDLTDNDVIQLSPCIIYLTELYLSGNRDIGAASMNAISTVITNAKSTSQEVRLNKLNIHNCDITDNDLIQLSPCIIYLTELDLSGNRDIGGAGMKAISTVITNAKSTSQEFRLDKLNISNCDLTDNDVNLLSPCIIYLTELDLSFNKYIGAAAMNAISTVIKHAKVTSQEFRMDKLNISNCDLIDNDLIQLSPCIIYLTELDLRGNRFIGADGMKAISTVINNAKGTLKVLGL